MTKKFAKETVAEKNKRFKALFKEIKRLLKVNKAGIFAVPNPITKQIGLQIMDQDDLETFNKHVQENIKQREEEALKSELQAESDKLTDEEKENIKKILTEQGDYIAPKPDAE